MPLLAQPLPRTMTRVIDNAGATAFDCAVTIVARMPVLAGWFVVPNSNSLAEWHRASTEKLAAAVEGAFAAGTAWQGAMWRSTLRPRMPAGIAVDFVHVMREASRPTRRRVRANARRLTGPLHRPAK
jgi:hypothetical protein